MGQSLETSASEQVKAGVYVCVLLERGGRKARKHNQAEEVCK